MKKKIEQLKELIKNLKKTDRGRALLFFLGYLIFFIVVFIFIQTANKTTVNRNDYENGTTVSFNVDKVKNNNYSYKYTITVDINDYEFIGERNRNLETFNYNNIDYFKDYKNNKIYKKTDDKWNLCDNPNDFDYLTNIDNIWDLANNATYISKTDYESGKTTYNYEISTTTIEKIINDVEIDLDDKPNELVFSSDEEGNVIDIKMKLDSFGKYKNYSKKYFSIDLEYDDFGEIKSIENPIKE